MNAGAPSLTVKRTLLQESVRRLRRSGKESLEPVCLEFAEETLTISWAGSSEQVPAKGRWPGATHVPAGWLRALSKVFPAADPVTIRIEGGRVITETLSCGVVDPGEQAELIDAKIAHGGFPRR